MKNSFPTYYSDFQSTWDPTYRNLGITLNGDPKNGLALGPYENLAAYDPTTATRSFAATAYYLPNIERPNLKVLTNALVNKVLFASRKRRKDPLTATGLCFTVDGKTYEAKAKREVIVSAGTFQSPHLLELSGVGGKRRLKRQGVPVLIDNPNVGENLQDHLLIPLGFQTVPGELTQESFRDLTVFAAVIAQYQQNKTGLLATIGPLALLSFPQILSTLPHPPPITIEKITRLQHQAKLHGSRRHGRKQSELTFRKLLDSNEATAQILTVAGGISPQFSNNTTLSYGGVDPTTSPNNYYTLVGILEHPFSRGSVHITSPDPTTPPAINPNYLSHPLDLSIASTILLHLQSLARTEPLASKLAGKGTVFQPGYDPLLTPADAARQVQSHLLTEFHPLGTCAMLPATRGGVVNSRLKVYGTTNLRVVDASIFPLMVRSNLQTLVYAVAERAAEWIREDAGV